MITITTTQIRPSLDVEFYILTEPLVHSTFQAIVNSTVNIAEPPVFSMSEDGLVHVSVAKYADEAQLNGFLTEMETLLPGFFEARQVYSDANGIDVQRAMTIS